MQRKEKLQRSLVYLTKTEQRHPFDPTTPHFNARLMAQIRYHSDLIKVEKKAFHVSLNIDTVRTKAGSGE